jgi:hypothetical protein
VTSPDRWAACYRDVWYRNGAVPVVGGGGIESGPFRMVTPRFQAHRDRLGGVGRVIPPVPVRSPEGGARNRPRPRGRALATPIVA